jgi:hypothetical protein
MALTKTNVETDLNVTTPTTPPQTRLQRLGDWIDSLPEFWRPIVYGAGLVVLWMGMRGAFYILPIVLVYVFVTSQTPLADIGKGVIVVALAMLGGALGGLAYSVIGQPLRRRGAFGRYLAGIVTLAPYMFVLGYILDFTKGQTLFRWPSRENVIVSVLMSIFFGVVMGRSWFANPEKSKPARRAT